MLPDLAEFKNAALGYIRSFVEFTDESVNGKNSSRASLVEWWEELIGDYEKISIQAKESTEDFIFQRTYRFYERILPSICVFQEGLGVDIGLAIKKAMPLLEGKHVSKIQYLKQHSSSQNTEI